LWNVGREKGKRKDRFTSTEEGDPRRGREEGPESRPILRTIRWSLRGGACKGRKEGCSSFWNGRGGGRKRSRERGGKTTKKRKRGDSERLEYHFWTERKKEGELFASRKSFFMEGGGGKGKRREGKKKKKGSGPPFLLVWSFTVTERKGFA